MERMNGWDWAACIMTIVGALNWGLVGLFQFDLVAVLFGGQGAALSRVVYTLVGLSGAYAIYRLSRLTAGERRHALS